MKLNPSVYYIFLSDVLLTFILCSYFFNFTSFCIVYQNLNTEIEETIWKRNKYTRKKSNTKFRP